MEATSCINSTDMQTRTGLCNVLYVHLSILSPTPTPGHPQTPAQTPGGDYLTLKIDIEGDSFVQVFAADDEGRPS